MTRRRYLLPFLVVAAASLQPLTAHADKAKDAEVWMTVRAMSHVRANRTVDQARNGLMQVFTNQDVDGGGITASDQDLQTKLNLANRRASEVSRALRMDLNADGAVSIDELKIVLGKRARRPIRSQGVMLEPTEEQVALTLDKLVRDQLRGDTDKNGIITFEEMVAAADKKLNPLRSRTTWNRNAIPKSLDQNGDGAISRDEFGSVADRVVEKFDTDSDGQYSAKEVADLRAAASQLRSVLRATEQRRKREARERDLAKSCAFPQVTADARLVALSASRGQALSDVSLKDDTRSVSVATAWIEPGDRPLYVVLSSVNAMIWQFSGSVDRVQAVVVATSRALPLRVGVVGIDADRVHIPTRNDCLRVFRSARGNKALAAKVRLKALAGRTPDKLLSATQVSTVSLPGGIFDRTPNYQNAVVLPGDGPAERIWRVFKRRYPGGLLTIDPAAVVSRAKARKYSVLPEYAGLARLVEEGALKLINTEQVIRYGGVQIVPGGGEDRVVLPRGKKARLIDRPSEYLIVKKIRLPSGLTGAYSAKFQLAPGVPEPTGPYGRSCIRYQESGEPLPRSHGCR